MLMCAGATAGLADHHGREHGSDEVPSRIRQELASILEDSEDMQLGELTMQELFDYAGRLSVREQEGEYIAQQKHKSFFLPGLGQFGTGDPLAGSLFLTGQLAIKAGTLTGAYVLLPESVQFGSEGLDYLDDSHADINAEWEALSFRDLAPSLGVLLGGSMVNTAYRFWAASDAGSRATRNVEDGTVQFEPQPIRFVGDRLGFGMSLRY